jgi:hypothetical protein
VGGSRPRRPLLQFRLRTLLILVALVALVLAGESTRRRWKSFQQQAEFHGSLAQNIREMAASLDLTASQFEKEIEAMNFPSISIFSHGHELKFKEELRAYTRNEREMSSTLHRDAAREAQLSQEYLRRW